MLLIPWIPYVFAQTNMNNKLKMQFESKTQSALILGSEISSSTFVEESQETNCIFFMHSGNSRSYEVKTRCNEKIYIYFLTLFFKFSTTKLTSMVTKQCQIDQKSKRHQNNILSDKSTLTFGSIFMIKHW